MKHLLLVALLFTGCVKAPVNLPAGGEALWRANEAVVSLGSVQHIAIELNKVERCEEVTGTMVLDAIPPRLTVTRCEPLLSDANTRIVVDVVTDSVLTLKSVPDGWRGTVGSALERIEGRLDAAGKEKLAAWLAVVRGLLATQ